MTKQTTDQTTATLGELEEKAYKNPSYDESLPTRDRLADFLGKYHVVLNGVVKHDPYVMLEEDGGGMCCQDHKVEIVDFVEQLIQQAKAAERSIDENTSDGYHTFKELYEFRKLYNAVLFNTWAMFGGHDVHKSKKHHDGEECFGGGWFIVMATTIHGQISNHYELKDWDLFKCEERDRADEWDGHTAKDVVNRLQELAKQTKGVDEDEG